ncbi:MAG: tetraacyldisaccharide 4'-kinase [Pyrinomonadaceae bacterium]
MSLLASIYGKIADARNRLYDRGTLRSFDLGARTISIGNITTGGTGKTPLVAYVASILAERGGKVCILTRGYGRENPRDRVLVSDGDQIVADVREAGDEPFELARKLLGKAMVIADADRVGAARWAREEFGVTDFVLDDGFQHRRAKRDVDIVCIDATNPSGDGQAGSLRSGRMLPSGRLREPVRNLTRVDIIVITRSDLVDDISDLRSEISDLSPNSRVFLAENTIRRIVEIGEFNSIAEAPQDRNGSFNAKTQRPQSEEPIIKNAEGISTEIDGSRVYAFCGLGNPNGFFDQIRRNGVDVTGVKAFADHYNYTLQDMAELQRSAVDSGAECLVTTAKDAVKLSDLKFEIPCYVVEIDVELDDPEQFAAML